MKSSSETYKNAGVDITAGYRAVELMKKHIARTMLSGKSSDIGGFGGLFIHLMADGHTCARTYRSAYRRTDGRAFTFAEQSADNSSCRSTRATADNAAFRRIVHCTATTQ